MKAFFVSDLHIKNADSQRALTFLNFLKTVNQEATHLIILGDLFDLWVGPHKYFQKKYKNIVDAIKGLLDNNIEVHYFEGNHDLNLEKFWGKDLGVFVHPSYHIFNFKDFVVRAEHGDLMNHKDRDYLFLRWLLRTKPLKVLSNNLPGKIIDFVGDRSSQASRIYTAKTAEGYTDQMINYTRAYAEEVFKKQPYDLIISGHTHVKDDYSFEVDNKKVRSVNLGSWFDEPKAFVITDSEQKFIKL